MTKKSGLADSPFFARVPVYNAPPASVQPTVAQPVEIPPSRENKPDFQSNRVTEFQTPRVPDKQSNRLPDFDTYDVPDFRKMQRIEVRLTWEQNKYLDDLEALIGRDAPEGDKSDPTYRRITKNSIIRVIVEILHELDIQVDASRFRNERDLLKAIYESLQTRLSKLQSSRLPE
jgi:hypothetical protein